VSTAATRQWAGAMGGGAAGPLPGPPLPGKAGNCSGPAGTISAAVTVVSGRETDFKLSQDFADWLYPIAAVAAIQMVIQMLRFIAK
jgi:hypothetical protein